METRQVPSCSGKHPRALLAVLWLGGLTACSPAAPPTGDATQENLWQFARANCLFQYFSARGWETKDIRAISGAYVELGDSDPDTYAAISEAIREWQPPFETKQDIDAALFKCFKLSESETISQLIAGK